MKSYFFLALHMFVVCSAKTQSKVAKDPPLTAEQQWLKSQLQQFYEQNDINVDKEFVVKQYVEILRKSKEITCSGLKAVEKLKLSGERLNNEAVKLKWYTISQKGGKKFAIQRLLYNSASGQFEHVGYVSGQETALGKAEYELLDNNTSTGKTFYRLQVLDTDGKLSYSETILVNGYEVPLTVKVLPNPTTSNNIAVELTRFTASESLTLMIIDAKGSVVFSKQNVAWGKNGGLLRLPNLNLTRGVYYMKVVGASSAGSTTFIVQ